MNLTSLFAFVCAALASTTAVASELEWGYKTSGEFYGPALWSEHYPTCAGTRQSPIDITSATTGKTTSFPLKFTGSCGNFLAKYTAETYKIEAQNSTCTLTNSANAAFTMSQFHMHAPSEHTVNGAAYDGEVHFVHSNADGSAITVVGVFLQASKTGKTDTFVKNVLNVLGSVSTTNSPAVKLSSYSTLITTALKSGQAYNYAGSLTTPACSETVDWWVISKPLTISSADLATFQSNLKTLPGTDNGKNARPVQARNSRIISVYK